MHEPEHKHTAGTPLKDIKGPQPWVSNSPQDLL